MPKVLNVIRDEHRSIAAILHGMQYLVNEIRTRGAKIDPHVFGAMVYYLDTFAERMHHPKEDRFLFAAIRRHGGEAEPVIEELEREHAAGEAALRELERDFVRYQEGGAKEFPAFARAVEKFTRGYRDHMRKEEEAAFPLAERLLSRDEWQDIEQAFASSRDPLAGEREQEDLQKLFTRIANLAPPPIGVGPA